MGIELHGFNFLKLQSSRAPLGRTLTVGRQSQDVSEKVLKKYFGKEFYCADGYCEPLLTALGAEEVSSIDFSDYEGATFIADLNLPVKLGKQFNTVIDSGTLEHIFDIGAAIRNVIALTAVGGRIIHLLPVNNLNGHGFWQFSSDLMYSIYSTENGFNGTEVYYASGLNFIEWFKIPEAKPGERIEVVSLEPVFLLCVTNKVADVESISVVQPFYLNAWDTGSSMPLQDALNTRKILSAIKNVLRLTGLYRIVRNLLLLLGLMLGVSRFSVRNSRFERINVSDVLKKSSV